MRLRNVRQELPVIASPDAASGRSNPVFVRFKRRLLRHSLRSLLAMTLFLGAVHGAIFSQEDTLRIYAALPSAKPPLIDGRLDEEAWQGLEEMTNFTCVLTKSGPASAQTHAWAFHDGKILYVAFRCEEPKLAEIERLLSEGHLDGWAECVEIFISKKPGDASYYQFRVNILGDTQELLQYDNAWAASWKAAINRSKEEWTVEVEIPFSSIGVEASSAAISGFNVNRSRTIVDPVEHSCWSNTGGGFHEPKRFGMLIFANYSEWLRAFLTSGGEKYVTLINRLIETYPASTARLTGVIEKRKAESDALEAEIAQAKIATASDCAPYYEKVTSLFEGYESDYDEVRLSVIENEFK